MIKRTEIKTVIILILFFTTFNCYSENNSFTLFLGCNFPQKDFANNYLIDGAGGAGTGFLVSAEYEFYEINQHIDINGGLDIIYNPYSKERKEYIDILADPQNYNSYINVPISLNASFNLLPDKKFSPNVFLGGLINSFWKTKMKFSYKDELEMNTMYHGVSFSFGAKVGVGMLLVDKVNLRIEYLYLGNPLVKQKIKDSKGTIIYESETKQKIILPTIKIGYKF